MPQTFRNVALYGGAITVDLPADFTDARCVCALPSIPAIHHTLTPHPRSTIRPVPDNQEVHLSPTTPTTLITDLLERAAPPTHPTCTTDEAALRYHYADITETGHGREGRDHEEDTTVLEVRRVEMGQL